MTEPSTRPPTVHVHTDPRTGVHRTDSDDFVHWWCPTLGPTSTLLARLLARSVTDTGTATWSADELTRLLGLGTRGSGLWHNLERLAYYRVVTFVSTDTLTVRIAMPSLRPRQLADHPHRSCYEHAEARQP